MPYLWGHFVSNHPLAATIPVTKHVKDELDSAGDSQLLEDSVDVVPDRMFLHLKTLCDFAVLHAVGDKVVLLGCLEPYLFSGHRKGRPVCIAGFAAGKLHTHGLARGVRHENWPSGSKGIRNGIGYPMNPQHLQSA